MSGYNGRRAPNFSQYLNDLNTIPSPYDQAQQQQEQQDVFDVDAELAMFTNAEFLDFDAVGDLPVDMPVKFETANRNDAHNSKDTSTGSDGHGVKYMDMLNDFNLPNYTSDYSSPMLPIQTPAYSLPQPQAPNHNGASITSSGDLGHSIPPQPMSARSSSIPASSSTAAPATATSQGQKRKQSDAAMTPVNTATFDDAARLAQEEDKRRRNTAASARFRIKKKEREKNMERTVKDVTAKNATLEARISQLEMENRWLKNLITEKNGSTIADGDIAGMFDKFREGQQQQQSGGVESRRA
ncbi:hypothetical protein AJ79_06062 [Helicocarpus griseus UAMH5409]|uniref:BZIP domain-containing protein n=1 Tax=Helicocarpus griseus UAMH5409 TaxID=1447875 RepID=A0A2B7XH76_9EURO|nr:hypothetical protein AJ79_06062 [Helicocarpus griseus UAMH5409]